MSQFIGHQQCYDVLDALLREYERNGYTRLVQYAPGQTVLMDSKPAPGYVPNVPGKRETGVDYEPSANGTRVHIYYLAGQKADARARAEADRANRSGFDSHEIMGTLVSIRRSSDDSIQLLFVAGNRDNIENGVITRKVALRSVSVTRELSGKSGLIVAMSFDQMLGIPYHQLQSLLSSEVGATSGAISARLREIQERASSGENNLPRRATPSQRQVNEGR